MGLVLVLEVGKEQGEELVEAQEQALVEALGKVLEGKMVKTVEMA